MLRLDVFPQKQPLVHCNQRLLTLVMNKDEGLPLLIAVAQVPQQALTLGEPLHDGYFATHSAGFGTFDIS